MRRRLEVKMTPEESRRIAAFSAGRNLENLVALMNTRLFRTEVAKPPGSLPEAGEGLTAQPGLFGCLEGRMVFIIDVFMRHRVRRADVARLVPGKMRIGGQLILSSAI